MILTVAKQAVCSRRCIHVCVLFVGVTAPSYRLPQAKVWNSATGQCIRTMATGFGLCCAFDPGARYVALLVQPNPRGT